MVSKKKRYLGRSQICQKTLPDKNINHGGNDDQYWENRNPNINHINHGEHDVDIIHELNEKIFG